VSSISSISCSSPSEQVASSSWLSSSSDTEEACEESHEEGESRDGSRDAGIDGDGAIDRDGAVDRDGAIDGDGAINGARDDTTNATLNATLDKAGECRWGDRDEDLVNICSVSFV